jgi:hypothetical protein
VSNYSPFHLTTLFLLFSLFLLLLFLSFFSSFLLFFYSFSPSSCPDLLSTFAGKKQLAAARLLAQRIQDIVDKYMEYQATEVISHVNDIVNKIFELADSDKNGVLSRDEFVTYYTRYTPFHLFTSSPLPFHLVCIPFASHRNTETSFPQNSEPIQRAVTEFAGTFEKKELEQDMCNEVAEKVPSWFVELTEVFGKA